MSYDISFKVKVEGTSNYVEVGECDANITWNVRRLIRESTGLEWKNEENNGLCVNVIPYIQRGYNELLRFPNKYKQWEATNGWGTVDGTIRFFKRILDCWEDFCIENIELIEVATFWIE